MQENNLKPITDETFDQEVKWTGMPAVIDFWAPWCEPCKVVTPILEKLAKKYGANVKFLSMNVDEEKSKPSEYAVRSIPTVLFFKQGVIKNQLIGVHSEENFDKAIQSLL